MNVKWLKSRFIITTTILLFLVILFTFGMLEYRWFSAIAEEEYQKTYNSLIFSINRIISRELQRTELLTNWLDQMLENSGNRKDVIEDQLVDIYERFGPNSQSDYLFTTIGYVDLLSDEHRIRQYSERGFQEVSLPYEIDIRAGVASNTKSLTITASAVYIQVPLDEQYVILIELDLFTFIETGVLPEIEQVYQDIEINWMITPQDPDFTTYIDDQGRIITDYHYNPVRALMGDSYIETTEQFIPFLLGRGYKLPDFMKSFDIENKPKSENEMPPEEFLHLSDFDFILAGVSFTSSSSYSSSIERTLSIVFIGGILLILLIGFICLLLFYQMRRIQGQRQKEREFTASITHELRTPLTIIQSASDNLAEGVIKGERIPAYGKLIKQQTHRLGSMIENILVFSRIEDKKVYTYHESPLQLDRLLGDIEQQMGILAEEKGISLHWVKINTSKEVLTDKELLALVITNLISNGVYHAYSQKHGEIRITIRFSEPETLQCVVEDDGIGISFKEQKDIWKSYYRGAQSRDSQERGSGLGLFIVKRNVSILGGKVDLESPYQRLDGIEKSGCRFTINIPCKVENNG